MKKLNLSEYTSFTDFVEEYLPLEITTEDFAGLDYMIHSQETADSYDVFVFTDNVRGQINILDDVYYYDDNLVEAVVDAFMQNSYAYNFEADNRIYIDEDILEMISQRWDDDEYLKRDICDTWDIEYED